MDPEAVGFIGYRCDEKASFRVCRGSSLGFMSFAPPHRVTLDGLLKRQALTAIPH
jgi:hypothetical protein